MPDGTTRFSYQGHPIYRYMTCLTFREYTMIAQVSLANKIAARITQYGGKWLDKREPKN